MLSRPILALALALTSPGTPCLASDELPDMADGRVFGHWIDDEGNVTLGVTHGSSSFQARLVLWTDSEARTLEVNHGGNFPVLFKDIQAAPGGSGAFVLQGAMKVDESDHGAVVYQAYRVTSGGKLRQLWSIDTSQWIRNEPSIRFSPDGTAWAALAHGASEGHHFAFGNTRSMKIKRSETLVLHEERPRLQDSDFCFLSSDGPVLLVPYGDNVYLLRFTDFGVDSRRVKQFERVRDAYGASIFLFRWQPEERVLWGNDGRNWAAWDLWDLGVSGFPDEPFLRLEISSGEPHRVRGFIRKTVTDRRYRVEHFWQSPRIEHLNARRVSDWRPGKPISFAVSPSGQHAVALEEVRETKDGEVSLRKSLRRFELAPAVEPPHPSHPAGSEEVN